MKTWDIAVLGGGPAGIAAAVAADRMGMKTLLVERQGFLGGMATGGSLPALCPYTDGRNRLIGGIGWEALQRLRETMPFHSPFYDRKPDRVEGIDWYPIDPERLKRVLDDIASEAGVEVWTHTEAVQPRRTGQEIASLAVSHPGGQEEISAGVWIDCTGDAVLASRAGFECAVGDENGRVQAGTLCFRAANIDLKRFMDYARETGETGNLTVATARAKQEGNFPAHEAKIAGMAFSDEGVASFNCGHIYDFDPLNPASLARAEIEARRQLPIWMDFLRRYVPGMEDIRLVVSGPMLGVRESRRVVGEYVLTGRDHRNRADFPDAIAYYNYPIDAHASLASQNEGADRQYRQTAYRQGERYGIPYRSLIPKGAANLLVAGRCISCDPAMQASIRVVPCCFATGQAAGVAAALSVREKAPVARISVQALKDELKKQDCVL